MTSKSGERVMRGCVVVFSLLWCALGGWSACGDAVEEGAPPVEARAPGRYDLVVPEAWVAINDRVEADPFAVLRPEPVVCSERAYGAEALGFEPSFGVDTLECNYLAVSQPLLEALRAGDVLQLRLWHFDLVGPEGAVANLGVAIGGRVVWREVLPIPNDAALRVESIVVQEAVPAGSPVVFQVSNHGVNSYSLLGLELVVP